MLPLTGCSTTSSDPQPPVEPPKTNLGLQLINSETKDASPGYIIFDGSTQVSQDGMFDLQLEGNRDFTIKSGLGTPNDPESYVRTIRVNPAQSPNVLSIANPHTDFVIRDYVGNVVGELSRDGYDLEGKMDVTRFKGHMREAHFYATLVGTGGGATRADGNLIRWTETSNGFGPERIVFADVVSVPVGNELYMDEPDLLFDRYTQQFNDLIQPLYSYDLPFERVEYFEYEDFDSVNNIVLISGVPDLELLATVAPLYRSPDSLYGAIISLRNPLPDNETNFSNYDKMLNNTFSHEMAAGYNVVGGRPTINTRRFESILQQGRVPSMPESLPLVDLKGAGIVHNTLYEAGTHIDDIMGLPDGFEDPKYDLQTKQILSSTMDPVSGLYVSQY